MIFRRIDRYIPLKYQAPPEKELEARNAHKQLGHDVLRGLGALFKGGRGAKIKRLSIQGKIDHFFG